MRRMRVKMNGWSGMVVVLLMLMVSGCTDNNLEGREELKPGRYITVTADVVDMVATYGTPINSAAQMTDFGFFCSYTGNNQWNASTDKPNKMYNVKMIRNSSTGLWDYAGLPVEWDHASAADNYTFFAYAPFEKGTGSSGNGITVVSTANDPGIPLLTYTVPNTVENQPDLMVATARKNNHPTGHPVNMQLKHALTAIGFELMGNGETVVDISISGVSVSGKLAMDAAPAITWTNLDAPSNTEYKVSIAGGSCLLDATPYNPLAADGYLMMIPQALTSNAKVKITFNDGTDKEIELSSASPVWEAGKRVIYKVNLIAGGGPGGPGGGTGSGGITVKQESLLIEYQAQNPVMNASLDVVCTQSNGSPDPTAAWTLVSNQPWLTLTLNPNGSGAATTVSGTGSQTVYLVAAANSGTTIPRSAIIALNGKTFATNVVQAINPNIITGAGNIISVTSYIGAFWKHDQIGERIIKVNAGSYIGPWTATVTWLDSKWNSAAGDGVVLALGGTADPGVTWASGENPGDAENYPVAGNTYTISGDVAQNQDIIFRIGLQKPFTAYDEVTNPARYAVILLTYTWSTNTRIQKIFLRQGEGADFIMTKFDPIGATPNSRPLAVKIAPRNLTAATLNAQVGFNGTGANPGKFTDFPTQAGAYFQWAKPVSNTRLRWAYDPNTASVTSIWDNTAPPTTAFWDNLKGDNETCPDGYRRPNDGHTNIATTGTVALSEIRQSLWFNPQNAGVSNTENSVWGYYADGFFDRRWVTYPSGVSGSVNSTVAAGTKNVAYVGRLFFSPGTATLPNQSVFIPAAGYRYAAGTGSLSLNGTEALYHLTAFSGTTTLYRIRLTNTANAEAMVNTETDANSKNQGFPIRCVRD